MNYKHARPWIWSFAAIAFLILAVWFSRPTGDKHELKSASQEPAVDTMPESSSMPDSIGPLEAAPEPEESEPAAKAEPDAPEREPLVEPPSETSIEELRVLLEGMIERKDAAGVRENFPKLQALGPDGVAAASDLLEDLIQQFAGNEADLPRDAPPPGWESLIQWVELFSAELVAHVAAKRTPVACVIEFFMHLHLRSSWSEVERVALAGQFLLAEAEDDMYWPRYAAMFALQNMPSREAGDVATRYLELVPQDGYETVRHQAVWVIARRGWDADWTLIEHLSEKDPHEFVRGTAAYHLLARNVTERGLLIVGLEVEGTAASGGLKTGDVVKTVNGAEVDYQADLSDSYAEGPTVVVNRYGATMTIKLAPGRHGIDGRHVPPAFHK